MTPDRQQVPHQKAPWGPDQYQNFQAGLNLLPAGCREFIADHWGAFTSAPGSGHNHQYWQGGYLGHLDELFGIAALYYQSLGRVRPLPFTLEQALLVLFLHDVEKIFKRLPDLVPRNESYEAAAQDQKLIQQMVIDSYGFELTDEMQNALTYVHGEGDDYRKDRRVATPLAAFVHTCDYTSARIWWDEPLNSGLLPSLMD